MRLWLRALGTNAASPLGQRIGTFSSGSLHSFFPTRSSVPFRESLALSPQCQKCARHPSLPLPLLPSPSSACPPTARGRSWWGQGVLSVGVCQFPGAAVTQCHALGNFNNRNVLACSPGARSLRSRCWQCWFLLRPLSLANRWPSSLCLYITFFHVDLRLHLPSYTDTSHVGLEASMASS